MNYILEASNDKVKFIKYSKTDNCATLVASKPLPISLRESETLDTFKDELVDFIITSSIQE